MHSVISTTAALQLKVELAASGLEDGYFGHMSAAERLRRLKVYQNAWNTAKFGEDKVVDWECNK